MSVYPENPPGQAFVSQDTYASPGVALSGLGGGGGVSAGPDLTVSTITANGDITLLSVGVSTSRAVVYESGAITFTQSIEPITLNFDGQAKVTYGLATNFSDVVGTVFLPDIALYNPGGAYAASIHASTNVVTIEPSLSVVSLLNVSSINGVNWDFITSTLAG